MKYKFISIGVILALIMALSGCASLPEEHKGAAVGAGAGAATGAVAGAVIGKSTKAAVIGGLVGALVGGAVGHYAYDKQKTREETAKKYNYNTNQGILLTIENASVSSQTVYPGDVLQIKMTYAVLTPSPEKTIQVTETREITHEGELVGKPEAQVVHSNGTYTSTVPINLPTTAKKGVYRVRASVQSENVKDTREISFTVQ